MLPTPDISHVSYDRVYEPSEDSFLLLDTLSSATEKAHLHSIFACPSNKSASTSLPTASSSLESNVAAPLVVELGPGSGVVLAFVDAHASTILGTRSVLTAGVDINAWACRATGETVRRAQRDNPATHALGHLGCFMGDLGAPLRRRCVDVLIFNPPYVPTDEVPMAPPSYRSDVMPIVSMLAEDGGRSATPSALSFEDESYLLALSYAGGRDGMETTDRLLEQLPDMLSARGSAYLLLCAQNRPDEVRRRIEGGGWGGGGWRAVMVGSSGKTAGREKLQVLRIWRPIGESGE